ncbi:MAG: glycosyltransferase [Patescibacteria group bacterium]|jgi:UDP-glucose:tetrahydrobiopterin glucosyltransferase
MSKRKLRILLTAPALGPLGSGENGGVERRVSFIKGILKSRGHVVSILALKGSKVLHSEIIEIEGNPPVDVTRKNGILIKKRHGPSAVDNIWNTAGQLQKNYDVIIGLNYDAPAYKKSTLFSTPVGHMITVGSLQRTTDRALAEFAKRHVHCVSFLTLTQAKSFTEIIRPYILRPGAVVNRSEFIFHKKPQDRLVWSARITPVKGLRAAFAVADRLQLPLDIFGKMQDVEYFKKCIADFSDVQYTYHGFVSSKKLSRIIGRARVMIAPYHWVEGFGLSIIESLACGTPVVALRMGGPAEIITPTSGVLCRPEARVEELCRAVQKAWHLNRQKVLERAKDFSSEKFGDALEKWIFTVERSWK